MKITSFFTKATSWTAALPVLVRIENLRRNREILSFFLAEYCDLLFETPKYFTCVFQQIVLFSETTTYFATFQWGNLDLPYHPFLGKIPGRQNPSLVSFFILIFLEDDLTDCGISGAHSQNWRHVKISSCFVLCAWNFFESLCRWISFLSFFRSCFLEGCLDCSFALLNR